MFHCGSRAPRLYPAYEVLYNEHNAENKYFDSKPLFVSKKEVSFDEFSPVSLKQWEEKIVNDLKGKSLSELEWNTGDNITLIPYYNKEDEHIRFHNEYMEFYENGEWIKIDVAFRYLTQKPWNRLPISSKTVVVNPIITCLAGGRNKLMASKAYDIYNTELAEKNLKILTPQTIWDVNKNEIPIWVLKMGGKAVVKVPYSNAGQGVYTITNQKELNDFMSLENFYEKFIVQSLIGNSNWSSVTDEGKFYHVGTMPNKKGDSYVLDFRVMIHATKDGYKPLSLYARRALSPLKDELEEGQAS